MNYEERIKAYDYVLVCLKDSQRYLEEALSFSFSDIESQRNSAPDFMNYAFLTSEPYIAAARNKLETLGDSAKELLSEENTMLLMKDLADGQTQLKHIIEVLEKTYNIVMEARTCLLK